MATTTTVLESLRSDVRRATHLSVLTPNRKTLNSHDTSFLIVTIGIGLEKAIANNVEEVAVFGAASETFSKRNINKSIGITLLFSLLLYINVFIYCYWLLTYIIDMY